MTIHSDGDYTSLKRFPTGTCGIDVAALFLYIVGKIYIPKVDEDVVCL